MLYLPRDIFHLGTHLAGQKHYRCPFQRCVASLDDALCWYVSDEADISALAQAKSANYSGQFIALRNYGIPLDEVSKLYLAGGFANYVNVESAVNIGFIANIPAERIVKAGNASLEGATIMLLSGEMRSKMEDMARQIEHIELETTPDFFDIFVEGCMFNPMQKDIS